MLLSEVEKLVITERDAVSLHMFSDFLYKIGLSGRAKLTMDFVKARREIWIDTVFGVF